MRKGRCRRVSLCKEQYEKKEKTLPMHAHKKQTERTIRRYISQIVMTPANPRKGARACTCHQASYTLEAAVILPLLAGFFAFLLFFFRVLQVQTGIQAALYCAGRETACEAGSSDSSPVLFALAEVHFRKEIKKYAVIDDFVAGGANQITLLRSDFSGDYIDLKADYYIKSPINFINIHGIYTTQECKIKKWTGDGGGAEPEDYVYVTKRGSVYHRSRFCRYLDLSIRAVRFEKLSELRNKDGGIYDPCSVCAKNGEKSSFVYITDYGERYHSRLSCRGLKRSIRLVPLSEVRGRGPCSVCGEQENKKDEN